MILKIQVSFLLFSVASIKCFGFFCVKILKYCCFYETLLYCLQFEMFSRGMMQCVCSLYRTKVLCYKRNKTLRDILKENKNLWVVTALLFASGCITQSRC